MADAAAVVDEVSEPEISEVATEAPEEALPDFKIFGEEGEAEPEAAPEPAEGAVEPPPEEKAPEVEGEAKAPEAADDSWSSRVVKDREQRRREIDLKRYEQGIQEREQRVSQMEGARENILKDPDGFFRSVGLDPVAFYQDWSERLATGKTTPSSELQLSSTQQELNELKARLAHQEQESQQRQASAQHAETLKEYDQAIGNYRDKHREMYPLTARQCSEQDIREGIVAYYQETGVELSLEEAFKTVEDGLRAEEDKIFNDPEVIARFKQHHSLEAADSKQGQTASRTLSSTMEVAPTKKSPEDMSHDEIIEHYSGKLFT
jgi:hypothetical protein